MTGFVLCRIDAPIYFANVEWIRGRVDKYRKRANADEALGPIHYVRLEDLLWMIVSAAVV